MRTVLKRLKAKDLGVALRKRLRLAPDDEIDITVTRRNADHGGDDPWLEMKGILSPHEADEMIRMIMESKRSKSSAPDVEEP